MEKLGLYLHVPFCAQLCHYCDFAKTARFSEGQVETYFSWMSRELTKWIENLEARAHFTSVFFGGGTPSLFTTELARLFEVFADCVASDAEVTLEVNPEHATADALELWKGLGFNRVSLGVQTFSKEGLRFLTRRHSPETAERSLERSRAVFENVNIDLIYGWPTQSLELLKQDVRMACAYDVKHVSAYALTYEESTTLGRKRARGSLGSIDVDQEADQYHDAYQFLRGYLGDSGFGHEEISNWYQPGFEAKHNRLYWEGDAYLGVGAGAHSFFPWQGDYGQRLSYSKKLFPFMTETEKVVPEREELTRAQLSQDLLLTGLRTQQGVALHRVHGLSQQQALSLGKHLHITTEGFLRLDPAEWVRENYYLRKLAEHLD